MPHNEDLKLYSLLIRWSDEDSDQGDYRSTVWARDEEEAEAFVRQQMADECDHDEDEAHYGSVIDISEGAFWKAADIEGALREIASLAKTGDAGALAKIAAISNTALEPLDLLPSAEFEEGYSPKLREGALEAALADVRSGNRLISDEQVAIWKTL